MRYSEESDNRTFETCMTEAEMYFSHVMDFATFEITKRELVFLAQKRKTARNKEGSNGSWLRPSVVCYTGVHPPQLQLEKVAFAPPVNLGSHGECAGVGEEQSLCFSECRDCVSAWPFCGPYSWGVEKGF
ncbi:hypothetical protein UY3_08632 [Chelonia mydas]|uniref:Uncharacterized protein n=1 Tax=Chelonia mydas TaxID=8469 RepID=M7BQ43_CHEMY|nr:hypothetical protein UY3_08632 [Chelonia mydas]